MGAGTEWLGAARVRFWLVCALVAAGLVPVLSRGAEWLGSWKMALDWGTSSVILLGPGRRRHRLRRLRPASGWPSCPSC